MQYNFGLKRMEKTPLQELVAMRNARIDAETKQKADARTYVSKNAQKELFTKKVDGKDKFFVREDDGEGNLRDQEITKLQYESDKSSNEYINSQRKLLGLDQTDIATDDRTPPPKPGVFKRLANLFKGDPAPALSSVEKVDKVAKPTGDITKNNIENTAVGTNSNVAGVTDPLANAGGGKVKTDLSKPIKPVIKETSAGLPMDVTNQAQTSKIYAGTPETEQAYKDSLSLKGKPPPNPKRDKTFKPTSEAELKAISARAVERSKDFSTRQIGSGATGQQLRKQGEFLKGGYKKSYERAKQAELMSSDERKKAQHTSGRLKLPSMRRQDVEVSDKIQADRLKKARASYATQSQQPDMADDVAVGKIKQQGNYLPDTSGALSVIHRTETPKKIKLKEGLSKAEPKVFKADKVDPYSKYKNKYAGGFARRRDKTKKIRKEMFSNISKEFKNLPGINSRSVKKKRNHPTSPTLVGGARPPRR
jgi:hypothetical protein